MSTSSFTIEGMAIDGINHPLSPPGKPIVVDAGTVNINASNSRIQLDFFDANGNDAGNISVEIRDGKLVATLSPRTHVGPPIECVLENEMHLED